jgi:hypothetical protein
VDGTVVLAVALGLGSLLLWSLLILVEDMADARRNPSRRSPEDAAPPAREDQRRAAVPRRVPEAPAPPVSHDPRFEQLVDQWFGPDGADPDDPWRRTA